jgi:Ser/Thr protein kinase RdoA (MazF antagonist)
MTYFPVTNSNLSPAHLGLFVQEKYSLHKSTTCKLIRAGINDTYLVISNLEKYVFRVYSLNWRTKVEIEEEIRMLNELRENRIPVSYAVVDRENNYLQKLNAPEGDRFGVLFTYAEGEKLHRFPGEVHYQVGELMAQIHKVTHNQSINRVTYSPEVLLVDSLVQIEHFLNADSEEMTFLGSTQQYLLNQLLGADVSQMRPGIVHLDIWFDNLNITSCKHITLFDFDFCGNGWLALDIAYYIMQLHNVEKYDEKEYLPKVDSFLEGYESFTTISTEEKRLIPTLGVSLYYFYLGIQCRRYDNWSNSFLSEDYLKRFINGLVKRYFDIYKLQ